MAQAAQGIRPTMSLYMVCDEYIKLEANGGNRLLFGDPGISIQIFKAANQIGHTMHKREKWMGVIDRILQVKGVAKNIVLLVKPARSSPDPSLKV